MERKLLGNEDSLANMFGKPTNETAIHFYTGANFLAYGNNLQVVRVAQDNQLNATTARREKLKTRSGWCVGL